MQSNEKGNDDANDDAKVDAKGGANELSYLLEELYLKRSSFSKSKRDENLFHFIQSEYSHITASKVVVISGTNGKGTVAKALEALFHSQKLTTGLFTSPHLIQINERIKINGISISDEELKRELLFLKSSELFQTLSFFEVLTLIACRLFFKIHQIDIAIFEVGLGGVHDPVNAIPHHWAAITQVALDHTELLGKDLPSIAAHKFGIAPNTGILFLGDSELLKFEQCIEKVSKDCPILVHPAPEIFETFAESKMRSSHLPTFGFRAANSTDSFCPKFLNTYYSAHNLSYALFIFYEMMRHLNLPVEKKKMKESLSEVFWPGRLHRADLIGKNVYLSGDHNPHGILALSRTLNGHKAKKIIFLLGKNPLKPFDEMKNILEKVELSTVELIPDNLFLGKPSENLPTELKDYLAQHIARLEEDEILIITGSLYLVGGIYKMYGYYF